MAAGPWFRPKERPTGLLAQGRSGAWAHGLLTTAHGLRASASTHARRARQRRVSEETSGLVRRVPSPSEKSSSGEKRIPRALHCWSEPEVCHAAMSHGWVVHACPFIMPGHRGQRRSPTIHSLSRRSPGGRGRTEMCVMPC
ncbi:hypothetical protein PVAP13_4KG321105 [Panicum virgatum]|uniref:Uncharacterized protein n=1 Tax=Panicum virgatum TaxID=38727 RepID=A0A8T0TVH2_PANVG|nr:hypothetical protein PVAP13_4KG321105 [Panicum virgatum]